MKNAQSTPNTRESAKLTSITAPAPLTKDNLPKEAMSEEALPAALRSAWAEREPQLYAAEREVETLKAQLTSKDITIAKLRSYTSEATRLEDAQQSIVLLRERLDAVTKERDWLDLQLGNLHGRIGLFAEKWWMINNNLSTDETFKQIEEQIVDGANKDLRLIAQLEKLELERDGLAAMVANWREYLENLASDLRDDGYKLLPAHIKETVLKLTPDAAMNKET